MNLFKSLDGSTASHDTRLMPAPLRPMIRFLAATSAIFLSSAIFSPAAPFDLELRSISSNPDRPASQWRTVQWDPTETAFIVCDMWDSHHSVTAVRRANEFAPRLNAVLKEARDRGATIIHSPSDCMPFYKRHPARKRALAVPAAEGAPADIAAWCHRIPAEEGARYPIDQSDGGEDETQRENEQWNRRLVAEGRNAGTPWLKQNLLLDIADSDFIAAEGDIVWNILQARGIKHVVLSGVHTNMCVLGRPFGLRRMVAAGMDTTLLRDCTDVMYNPARWPYVSHFTGIDLVIRHIESYVCPTVSSDQFVPGDSFQFKRDTRPRITMVIREASPLVDFARHCLGTEFSVEFRSDDELSHLDHSDILLLESPSMESQSTREYLSSGRPVIVLNAARQGGHANSFERSIRGDSGRSATTSQGNNYDFQQSDFRLALLNALQWAVDLDPASHLPVHPDTRRWSEDWAPASLTELPQSDSLWLRTLLPEGQSAPDRFTWTGANGEVEAFLNGQKLASEASGKWIIDPIHWRSDQLNLLVVHAGSTLPSTAPKLGQTKLVFNWQVISSKDSHIDFPIPPQFGAPTDLIQTVAP